MAYNEHWADCTLALRFNGSNGSQTFTDDKGLSTLTAVDTAALSTAYYDSAPTSLYLDGNTTNRPRVNVSSIPAVTTFGTGALTIAFSFYLTDVTSYQVLIYCMGGYPKNGFEISVESGMLVFEGNPSFGELRFDAAVSANTLHRVMVVRNGSNQWRLMLDGVMENSFTQSEAWELGDSDAYFAIGARATDGLYNVNSGFIDEVYFVSGVALEWANYTPAPFFDAVGFTPTTGTASLPVSITVQGLGAPSIPISVSVGSSGSAALGVAVSVINSAYLSGASLVSDGLTAAAVWSPRVSIDGVDVTDDLLGQVEVEGSEGDARIATFTLAVDPGTTVSLPDYVGAAVLVEISDAAGNNRLRLFSGKIDLPDLDVVSRTIRCSCTDDLQNQLAACDRAFLDGLIGGRWSAAVFDGGAGSWRYAQDRLSTVPAALDLSPYAQLRLTPWQAKLTADIAFTADHVLDGSVAVAFAERSALVNEVNIEFGYRFPRMKSEGYEINFSYITNGFSAWVNAGNGFLFRAAVVAAIEQAGGTIVSISYVALPTTAQIVGGGFWIPNPATDPLMCLGFDAVVSFDYTQDVDETHAIRVHNASSLSAVGRLADNLGGALAGVALDNSAAETGILLYKKEISNIPPLTSPTVVAGQTNAAAITLTAETDRAAAEAAMETLIDVAKVRIAASHRASRVSVEIPLNPAIDVDKTLSVIAQGVDARGKCVRFRHSMDADSGRATTAFSIALCSLSGLGIADAGDATAAPAGVADGVTAPLGAPTCVYNGLFGQDQAFTVTFPAVAAGERNAANVTISTDVAAPLIEDHLVITL